MGNVSVFAGASLRPQWPPADACARAVLLSPKPWREAADIRDVSAETLAPEFRLFLELGALPTAPEVSVESARSATRTRARVWEGATHRAVTDPEDYDGEDPRIYAPRNEEAAATRPGISDFRDYGDPRDRATVASAVSADGFAGVASGSKWLQRGAACPRDRALRRMRAAVGWQGWQYQPLRRQRRASISKHPWPPMLSRIAFQGLRITSRSDF